LELTDHSVRFLDYNSRTREVRGGMSYQLNS